MWPVKRDATYNRDIEIHTLFTLSHLADQVIDEVGGQARSQSVSIPSDGDTGSDVRCKQTYGGL